MYPRASFKFKKKKIIMVEIVLELEEQYRMVFKKSTENAALCTRLKELVSCER